MYPAVGGGGGGGHLMGGGGEGGAPVRKMRPVAVIRFRTLFALALGQLVSSWVKT